MEILKGQTLIKKDGSSHPADSALAGKPIVMIYFSAHWCPPCKAFTPVLKDFYEVSHKSHVRCQEEDVLKFLFICRKFKTMWN